MFELDFLNRAFIFFPKFSIFQLSHVGPADISQVLGGWDSVDT